MVSSPHITRASACSWRFWMPLGESSSTWGRGPVPTLRAPPRADGRPCRGGAGQRQAQLTPSLCIQEAEQSFISELAALARVPLAESKPFSNKHGLSGES